MHTIHNQSINIVKKPNTHNIKQLSYLVITITTDRILTDRNIISNEISRCMKYIIIMIDNLLSSMIWKKQIYIPNICKYK